MKKTKDLQSISPEINDTNNQVENNTLVYSKKVKNILDLNNIKEIKIELSKTKFTKNDFECLYNEGFSDEILLNLNSFSNLEIEDLLKICDDTNCTLSDLVLDKKSLFIKNDCLEKSIHKILGINNSNYNSKIKELIDNGTINNSKSVYGEIYYYLISNVTKKIDINYFDEVKIYSIINLVEKNNLIDLFDKMCVSKMFVKDFYEILNAYIKKSKNNHILSNIMEKLDRKISYEGLTISNRNKLLNKGIFTKEISAFDEQDFTNSLLAIKENEVFTYMHGIEEFDERNKIFKENYDEFIKDINNINSREKLVNFLTEYFPRLDMKLMLKLILSNK